LERGGVGDKVLTPVTEHHPLIGPDAAQPESQEYAGQKGDNGDGTSRDRNDPRRAGQVVHRA
jgi:hypothetical protein